MYSSEMDTDKETISTEIATVGVDREPTVLSISTIDVKEDLSNDASDGVDNPLEIPGNEFWSQYWAHKTADEETAKADRKLARGKVPQPGKKKRSKAKKARKCCGLLIMVIVISALAISMISVYGFGGGDNPDASTSDPTPTRRDIAITSPKPAPDLSTADTLQRDSTTAERPS